MTYFEGSYSELRLGVLHFSAMLLHMARLSDRK